MRNSVGIFATEGQLASITAGFSLSLLHFTTEPVTVYFAANVVLNLLSVVIRELS